MFNHLPKTGGTYLKREIMRAVPYGSAAFVNEFTRSTAKERRDYYAIASVRDPCDIYGR